MFYSEVWGTTLFEEIETAQSCAVLHWRYCVWGTTLFEEIETLVYSYLVVLLQTKSVGNYSVWRDRNASLKLALIAYCEFVWGTTLFEEIETPQPSTQCSPLPMSCGELLCLKRSKHRNHPLNARPFQCRVGNYSVWRDRNTPFRQCISIQQAVWGTTLFEEIETTRIVYGRLWFKPMGRSLSDTSVALSPDIGPMPTLPMSVIHKTNQKLISTPH